MRIVLFRPARIALRAFAMLGFAITYDVVAVLVLLFVVPIYCAQRLSSDTAAGGRL